MIRIKSDKIIVGERLFDGYMYVTNGIITEITKQDKPVDEEYDYTGKYVSAGFIDMHTHGAGGYAFMNSTVEDVINGCDHHLAHGTTTIVPTISAGEFQTMKNAVVNIHNAKGKTKGNILGALGFDKNWKLAFSCLKHTPMSSGDSDDYCKLILIAPNKPVVDVEINNTDAYSGYNVKIQGTHGTFKCNTTNYEYKYIIEGENPARPVIEGFLQDDDGNPKYCGEKLIAHEQSGKYNGTAIDVGTAKFYEDLYYKLTEGKEMYVNLSMARDIVSLIEQLYANSPLSVKF